MALYPEIVARCQKQLVLRGLILGLIWAGLAGTLTFLALGLIAQLFSVVLGVWVWVGAGGAAVVGAGLVLWRYRHGRSQRAVALWIEEQVPELNYALLTLGDKDAPFRAQTQARVAAILEGFDPFRAVASKRALMHAGRPLTGGMVLIALLYALSFTGWSWTLRPPALEMTRVAIPDNRLADITGQLIPPAYTGWDSEELTQFERVRGLAGSELVISGQGGAGGITGQLGSGALYQAVGQAKERDENHGDWSLTVPLPIEPDGLILSDGSHRRVIVLESRADDAPLVQLDLPEYDEDRTDPDGTVDLSATMRDDIGLAHVYYELVVARGPESGDYGFEELRVFETRLAQKDHVLKGRVALSDYSLSPGDQVSIRAVAEDANDLSGPGIGYSETRTIRIIRDIPEADIKINPAPLPLDESMMSLRMLIRETERLEARRDTFERMEYVRAVAPLREHTETIRQKVQGFIDETSQGGAFDVPDLMVVALDAMWEASRQMSIAETDDALPEMRRAYEALKALFQLTRYFLRGEMLPAVADVEAVRMTGDEPVHATDRSERARFDTVREALSADLEHLLREYGADFSGDPLREELAGMQVKALRDLPEISAAIQALYDAIGTNTDTGTESGSGGGAADPVALNAALGTLRGALNGAPRAGETVLWQPGPEPVQEGE